MVLRPGAFGVITIINVVVCWTLGVITSIEASTLVMLTTLVLLRYAGRLPPIRGLQRWWRSSQ
jgi:hypothetical protein